VLASQIRSGDPATAIARLSRGGWIAVSEQLASERHLHIGDTLVLPIPSGPMPLRIAATTTNLAWPPGVIFMNTADHTRAWSGEGTRAPGITPHASADPTGLEVTSRGAADPTALGVTLPPGADARAVRSDIERALGPASGLEVSLAAERAAKIDALAGEGLGQLRVISTLLLLAAIVAMVAALGSSIWQRRAGLAGLRLFGARPVSLQAILLLEALIMLGAGCLTGAIAGIYGQVVIDGFLRHVTGFPLASPTADIRPLEVFALVLCGALALGAIPGWLACRVRPVVALASE
jgi:putative ABC transport system permease protein